MWIDIQEKQLRQKLGEIREPSFYRREEETAEARTFEEMVEWDEGKPRLKKEFAERLERELLEIDDALQYVLLANRDGQYPCKGCPGESVFLNKGEVWRYGVTRKGEKGRYSEWYLKNSFLDIFVQFRGDMNDCLKQEKLKIFNYPLLPENLARPAGERLASPPGNLRTD